LLVSISTSFLLKTTHQIKIQASPSPKGLGFFFTSVENKLDWDEKFLGVCMKKMNTRGGKKKSTTLEPSPLAAVMLGKGRGYCSAFPDRLDVRQMKKEEREERRKYGR